MVCTFFGHKSTPREVECALEKEIIRLIEEKDVRMFYVGNQGGFDNMAFRVLKRLKPIYPQVDYYVVLAYLPKDKKTAEMYGKTLFPQGMELVPPRFAISKRNEWMIENSDYVIAYVKTVGGAAKFREFAKKKKKIVIDL